MVDRKARSFIFKIPPGTNLREVRNSIQGITGDDSIKVFQEINAHEYLVELTNNHQIQEIIEHSFDSGENHIYCHPSRGYYLNVSIMGLKAYVNDDEVMEKLSEYGEGKGSVMRLKYRQEHQLAELENGKRSIHIVLTAQSIRYLLQIDREWCRIIHSNQQLICTNCHEPVRQSNAALVKHSAISPTTVQRETRTTRKQQPKIQPCHMITPRT